MSHYSSRSVVHILFIEANPVDAERIDQILCEAHQTAFAVTRVTRFQEALERLDTHCFDLILLDLTRQDPTDLAMMTQFCAKVPGFPIVVLMGEDERRGAEAMEAGAHEYVSAGSLDGDHLPQALRYALTRHWMQKNIQVSSLTDELTGLKNGDGLVLMAEQQRKIAQRSGREFLLLALSLDPLAWTGADTGDREGDRALIDIAQILRKTFRATDVIARTGPHEFAVAVLDTHARWSAAFVARLEHNVTLHNTQAQRPYELKIRIGIATYRSDDPSTIEALLEEAHAARIVPPLFSPRMELAATPG